MQLTAATWKQVLSHLRRADVLAEADVPRADALLQRPRELDEVATALGLSREALLRGVADAENMPFVELAGLTPAPEALASVPEATVRRFGCLPLFLNGPELTVAVGEADWARLDTIRQALGAREVIFVLADARELAALIDVVFPSAAEAELAAYLSQEGGPARLKALGERAPVARIVDAVLERAVRKGASDVHLEPIEGATRVRYRVDGLLETAFQFDGGLHEAIVSRLKVLGQLNIAERQRPQDGRFAFEAAGRPMEARMATLRTAHGEKVVLRLLGHAGGAHATIAGLGLADDACARLTAMLEQPYGMVLVTGPTGSGKTSTLYAAIRHLGGPRRNVVTLEDPVEAHLEGINQVPMRPEIDLSFASALRAVLRQDPDVVLVGEIRDHETAEIAMRAAMTGHLLLSTLHTNSAAETPTRLIEMGVAPDHLAPALLGVVAQRMVRRLCACHTYRLADEDELAAVGLGYLGPAVPVPVARGCLACHLTGYRGRQAIFELLTVDAAIRNLIQRRAPAEAIHQAAVAGGMRPLWTAGLREVLAGRTTLEEVRRVVRRPV